MALPTPASSSDSAIGLGEPVARRRAPTSTSGPGQIRVASMVDGALREFGGDEALKARVENVRRQRSAEITAILKEYGVPLMDAGRTHAK